MDPDEGLPAEGFGDRLKRLVKLRGLDNGIIARELGVHLVTVSRWMGGQEPKGATLLALARLLRVSPDLLLEGQNEDPEPALRRNRAIPVTEADLDREEREEKKGKPRPA